MPPPRRIPAARRPRVAGRRTTDPAAGSSGPPGEEPGRDAAGRAAERRAETGTEPGQEPSEEERASARFRSGVATLVALVAVAVIALGLTAWFRGEANQLAGSSAASNEALVDVGATAQVSGQVRDAVERVYSYDFARLDDNERASRAVITGQFEQDFEEQFGRVRELAPQQKAVVVAKVLNLGVKVLDGDRAIVVVFLDQQADRGVETKQMLVAGRLTVTAQRVDGQWKIAGVEPF